MFIRKEISDVWNHQEHNVRIYKEKIIRGPDNVSTQEEENGLNSDVFQAPY